MLIALLSTAIALCVIPRPSEFAAFDGNWTLTPDSFIGYDANLESAKERAAELADVLRRATGYDVRTDPSIPEHGVYFGKTEAVSGPEEYTITMTLQRVDIRAVAPAGVFYGMQTFLQLLPIEILTETRMRDFVCTAPIVAVRDTPRFKWRGIMVDVVRHFQTVDTLKKLLDGMSRYKMNRLHLHFTDDQGWRIESKKFPNLTKIGAVRKESPRHWDREHGDGAQYGPFFYTHDEIRDLIAYAKSRHVLIVPEVEMPGHCLAALAVMPHLSCTGGPFDVMCTWGIESNVFCPGNDATLRFLEAVLDEIMELFDGEYMHVGGDECPKETWTKCPKCNARMSDERLESYDELQSWFTAHFANYVASKGKRLIGWDEIIQGGLKDGTTVMVWRDASSGTAAAKLGHDVIMTLSSAMYFDFRQFTGDDHYEYISGAWSSAHNVYMHDPAAEIGDEYTGKILGVQANVWSEYIWDCDDLEYKIYPRMASLSEVSWTPLTSKNWSRFLTDLVRVEYYRLGKLVVNAAPIMVGIAATWEPQELPVKWVNMVWPITGSINNASTYEIAFIWRSGSNGLRMKNVRLWIAGTDVGTDEHEGYAFRESEANIYTIQTLSDAGTSKLSISADVYCDGGSDTSGDIYIYPV